MKIKILYLLLLLIFISCDNSTVNRCEDSCNYKGELSCNSNHIMVCDSNINGCLELRELKDCTDEYQCLNGMCVCKKGSHFENSICENNRKDVDCNTLTAPKNMKSDETATIEWDDKTNSWDTSNCNWVCIDGYSLEDDKCVSDCGDYAVPNKTNDGCDCIEGYILENDKCIFVCNNDYEIVNDDNNGCKCVDGYYFQGDKCIIKCGVNEEKNNANDGCKCIEEFHRENLHCVSDHLNEGLISFYKFEDNLENSGEGDTEEKDNNISYVDDGAIGKAVSFNGVNSYIEIESDIFKIKTFSFQVWIKSNASTSRTHALLSYTNRSGYYGWELSAYYGSNLFVEFISSGGGNIFSVSSDYDIFDNQWHQVVFVTDDTKLKIYIDGQVNNSIAIPVNNKVYNGDMYLYLGASRPEEPDVNHYYYKGLLDEFRIYDRVLDISEIRELYQIKN